MDVTLKNPIMQLFVKLFNFVLIDRLYMFYKGPATRF